MFYSVFFSETWLLSKLIIKKGKQNWAFAIEQYGHVPNHVRKIMLPSQSFCTFDHWKCIINKTPNMDSWLILVHSKVGLS